MIPHPLTAELTEARLEDLRTNARRNRAASQLQRRSRGPGAASRLPGARDEGGRKRNRPWIARPSSS
jgi:hypothetical protein